MTTSSPLWRLLLLLTLLLVVASALAAPPAADAAERETPTLMDAPWRDCDPPGPGVDLSATVPWPIPDDWMPATAEDLYYAHQDQDRRHPFEWHPRPTGSACYDEWQRVVGLQWPTAADVLPVGTLVRPEPRCAPSWHGYPLDSGATNPSELVLEETTWLEVNCFYRWHNPEWGLRKTEIKFFKIRTQPEKTEPHLRLFAPERPPVGQPTEVTLALSDPSGTGRHPTGAVQLSGPDGTVVDSATLVSADQGEVDLTTPELAAGSTTFTARYAGDDDFRPVASDVEVISRHETAIAAPAQVRARPGRPVAFAATVSSDAVDPATVDLTGTLRVTDGGSGIGEFPVASDGTAQVHLEPLEGGTHDLGLTYSGSTVAWDSEARVQVAPDRWIASATVQTQSYGHDDWTTPALEGREGTAVRDGNPARLEVVLTNPTEDPLEVPLHVFDPDGRPVEEGERDVSLAPRGETTVHVPLDTRGRAWTDGRPSGPQEYRVTIDTPEDGPVDETATAQVVPLPLVLVHGWNSSASGWDGFDALAKEVNPLLETYAVGDGRFFGQMDTGNLLAPAVTKTIAQNAQQEASYIEGVRLATGAAHVDVVAHSMGGLISREYVADLMPTSPDDEPVVRHLVQMGTPNTGSPCADRLVELSWLTGQTLLVPQPSTYQLTTTFAEDHNAAYPLSRLRGVELSNLVGTGTPLPCGVPVDSDVVVPTDSARWEIPDADLATAGILHTSMTSDAALVRDYVVPRVSDAPGTGRPARAATHRAAATPQPAEGQTFGGTRVRLAGDQTREVSVEVPAGDTFGVTGLAPGVEVDLVDPDGRVVQHAEAPDPRMPVVGLTAPAAGGGTWTVRLRSTLRTGRSDVGLAWWVAGNAVQVRVDRAEVGPSGAAVVEASVSGATAGSVTATVTDGDASVPLVLQRTAAGRYAWSGVLAPASGRRTVGVVARTDQGTRVASAPVVATAQVPEPAPVPTPQPVPVPAPGPPSPAPITGEPTVPAPRAASSVRARVAVVRGRRVLVVRVSSPGGSPTGAVELLVRGRRVATGSLGARPTLRFGLAHWAPGRHRVLVRFGGTSTLAPSSSTVAVRVPRG